MALGAPGSRLGTLGFPGRKIRGPGFPGCQLGSLAEVESRTQGSRPRPRTQKKSEAKDSLSENRHSRGQGQNARGQGQGHKHKCSRKKKGLQAISKKKRSSQKLFRRSPQKNVFQKIFQAPHKILTIQKIVLCLRPRGLGQGLDLRGQGQGLQNVSSRPRTSSRTPPLVPGACWLLVRGPGLPGRQLGALEPPGSM